MTKLIFGIDPGLGGAIAVADVVNNTLISTPTPVIRVKGEKTQFDIPAMVALLDYPSDEVLAVYIEYVFARPKEGVSSSFRFGYGLGLWHGIIGTRGFSMVKVTPQKWKATLDLIGCDKDASRAKASELFPNCAGLWKRKKDDGIAESCLIRYYGALAEKQLLENPVMGS